MISIEGLRRAMVRQWTPELVGEWIMEAMETSRRLPGHRPGGYRIYWPDIARSRDVDYGDPFKHTDEGETVLSAERGAIDRLDEVQRWWPWMGFVERKIIQSWALNKPDRWIGRKLNLDHRKVKRMRNEALRGIALRLTLEGKDAA